MENRQYVTDKTLQEMGFRKLQSAYVPTFVLAEVSISKFHATPSWTMTVAGQGDVSPLTVHGVLHLDDIERGREIQQNRIDEAASQ